MHNHICAATCQQSSCFFCSVENAQWVWSSPVFERVMTITPLSFLSTRTHGKKNESYSYVACLVPISLHAVGILIMFVLCACLVCACLKCAYVCGVLTMLHHVSVCVQRLLWCSTQPRLSFGYNMGAAFLQTVKKRHQTKDVGGKQAKMAIFTPNHGCGTQK